MGWTWHAVSSLFGLVRVFFFLSRKCLSSHSFIVFIVFRWCCCFSQDTSCLARTGRLSLLHGMLLPWVLICSPPFSLDEVFQPFFSSFSSTSSAVANSEGQDNLSTSLLFFGLGTLPVITFLPALRHAIVIFSTNQTEDLTCSVIVVGFLCFTLSCLLTSAIMTILMVLRKVCLLHYLLHFLCVKVSKPPFFFLLQDNGGIAWKCFFVSGLSGIYFFLYLLFFFAAGHGLDTTFLNGDLRLFFDNIHELFTFNFLFLSLPFQLFLWPFLCSWSRCPWLSSVGLLASLVARFTCIDYSSPLGPWFLVSNSQV